MGKYDNYSNIKNIKAAQKKLDRLTRKRKPNLYKIELAQEELNTAKLFESCQIFKAFHTYAPNKYVMFSDDNRVMWFISSVIRYDDIKSYSIDMKVVTEAYTTTRSHGAVSRAIVGHMIAGDIGAVVGAMSADSSSETTYHDKIESVLFQVFTKDGLRHYCELPYIAVYRHKIHPKWLEVGAKIQRIIDGRDG